MYVLLKGALTPCLFPFRLFPSRLSLGCLYMACTENPLLGLGLHIQLPPVLESSFLLLLLPFLPSPFLAFIQQMFVILDISQFRQMCLYFPLQLILTHPNLHLWPLLILIASLPSHYSGSKPLSYCGTFTVLSFLHTHHCQVPWIRTMSFVLLLIIPPSLSTAVMLVCIHLLFKKFWTIAKSS